MTAFNPTFLNCQDESTPFRWLVDNAEGTRATPINFLEAWARSQLSRTENLGTIRETLSHEDFAKADIFYFAFPQTTSGMIPVSGMQIGGENFTTIYSKLADRFLATGTPLLFGIIENKVFAKVQGPRTTSKSTYNFSPSQRIWEAIYSDLDSGQEDAALGHLFEEIERAFSRQDLTFVDSILSDVNTTKANAFVLEGLLRGTYRARSKLRSWSDCLIRVVKQFESDRADASELLRGLIPRDGKPLFAATQSIL